MEISEAKEERSSRERLKELRTQRSLSQSELGEITPLHFTNINRLELLNQFKEVDRLPADKKKFIKRVIDALLVKEKTRNLAV